MMDLLDGPILYILIVGVLVGLEAIKEIRAG